MTIDNKDLKNFELDDEMLEAIAGGEYTECNRGYTCPICSGDKIRVFDYKDQLTYFCFDCGRGSLLNS